MELKIGEVKELLWRQYCREVCNYENPVIAEALRQAGDDVAAAVKLVARKWKLEPLGRM